MTTAAQLDTEIEDARSLLYHIEFALDNARIDEASLYASDLAEVMYRAKLLHLAQAENLPGSLSTAMTS